MFEGPDFPQPIKEETFQSWLEHGRESKIGYSYLLVVWNVYDEKYNPVYVENRNAIDDYERYPEARGAEALVAAYDLYSEGRIALSK